MFNDLIFRQLFDAVSSTYTYLIGDPLSREAIYIDTVFEQHQRDRALVEELDLKLVAVVDTHCHADHVTGAWLLQQACSSKIGISARYGDNIEGVNSRFDDGDKIMFGQRYVQVRSTPGHTKGCVSFVLDDQSAVFTGDALLIRGAGRCDFQEGSAATLYDSIHDKLFSLPDTCLLYPGHDYNGRMLSSIGEERAHNPRIGGQADKRDFVGFMENLCLPHPRLIDIAVPANQKSGKPEHVDAPKAALWGPVRINYAGLQEIEPEWVARNLDSVYVLDVRDEAELQQGAGLIKGSQFIPLSQLRDRFTELPQDKPIVAICHAGTRSAQATVILTNAGIAQVANIRGGMLLWQQLGLPVYVQATH
jgi:glyoxylase-like metal-dependent hydrolase (beta-lactamase superfamily II)/rhodanese-related sulfurtransferase